MNNLNCLLILLSLFSWAPAYAAPPTPVKLIFDTDMGNDIDDALALAMIHTLADRGECELLAVTVTKDHPQAAPFVDLLNTYYGRPSIPIGAVKKAAVRRDCQISTPVLACKALGQGGHCLAAG